ncbi:MAG: HAD hydrolase family protein [Dysgonamonadaceae bacterium]|jgi:3-deoxy-D-manno-octulosonate 8-phosphate phosphatase (KDO 8-P phosphatase)|nr:HAD hydrolase family protein [Dysgonamonadaceae bacterium]
MIDYDLKKIKALIFDVDGVLSPESVALSTDGEPIRTVNTKDGYALQLAAKTGLQLCIITGGDSNAVKIRFEKLGFQHVYLKAHNKIRQLQEFIAETGLKTEEICYVGDDIPDYQIMKIVGLPCCPADAAPEIKAVARYVSPRKGGEGVGRDIVEQVLKMQGVWMQDDIAFGW